VARRSLGGAVLGELDRLVRTSVEDALGNRPRITEYVRRHAQEMDEAVMRQHIDLYVTEYSVALGEAGRRAVEKLLDVHRGAGGGPPLRAADVFASPGV
jgi:1,4-dihydroxy-6-naphthoate synthase